MVPLALVREDREQCLALERREALRILEVGLDAGLDGLDQSIVRPAKLGEGLRVEFDAEPGLPVEPDTSPLGERLACEEPVRELVADLDCLGGKYSAIGQAGWLATTW